MDGKILCKWIQGSTFNNKSLSMCKINISPWIFNEKKWDFSILLGLFQLIPKRINVRTSGGRKQFKRFHSGFLFLFLSIFFFLSFLKKSYLSSFLCSTYSYVSASPLPSYFYEYLLWSTSFPRLCKFSLSLS